MDKANMVMSSKAIFELNIFRIKGHVRTSLACRKRKLTLQRSRFECSLEILETTSAASATPPEVCAWSRLD